MRIRRRIAWGLLVAAVLCVGVVAGGFYASGYHAYVVETGSMSPLIRPGDLVIDRPPTDHYGIGSIITFRHGPGPGVVTHRIVDITVHGIHTKGDANPTPDVWTIPRNYVQGVVRWIMPGAGFVVVFLKQPTGLVSLAAMVVGLILLWRLFFPPGVASSDKPGEQSEPQPSDDETPRMHGQADAHRVQEVDDSSAAATDCDERASRTAARHRHTG